MRHPAEFPAQPPAQAQANTPKLTLVSFDLCPYVQRAAIALAEKGVPFTRINVDLSNKPDWFKKISPLGKVPLLMVGERGEEKIIFESSVILEYLEEAFPNPLHPADALTRARHRAYMEFGSTILADIWTVETTADYAAFDAKVAVLKEKFARIEAELAAPDRRPGPFFAGEAFSLVDAVFAPVFRYFDILDGITDLGVFDDLPHTQAWRKALAARPSVSGAVPANYAQLLDAFLAKYNGVIARLAKVRAAA
jgi:glutathione S-transferase